MNKEDYEVLKTDLSKYIRLDMLEGINFVKNRVSLEKLLEFCNIYKLIHLSGQSDLLLYSEQETIIGFTDDDCNIPIKKIYRDYSKIRPVKQNYNFNIEIERGKKIDEINIIDYFLKHRTARSLQGVDFIIDPKLQAANPLILNLWKGFTVDTNKYEKIKYQDVKPFLLHMYKNLCSKDKAQYRYLHRLLTHLINYPHKRPGIATVLAGKQGIGKDTFMKVIRNWMHDNNYIAITNIKYLVGFNSLIEGKLVVFCNEALFSYDKTVAGTIKGYIVDDYLSIEHKFVDSYDQRNNMNLFIASNNIKESALIEENDRRYFVCDCSKVKDVELLELIHKLINNENLSDKLFTYFTKFKNTINYNFRENLPKTKTHSEIQSDKIDPVLQFLGELAYDGYDREGNPIVFKDFKCDYELKIPSNKLFDLYIGYLQTRQDLLRHNKLSNRVFSQKLENDYHFKKIRTKSGCEFILYISTIIEAINAATNNKHSTSDIHDKYFKPAF